MSEVEVRTGSVRQSSRQMRTRGERPPRLQPVTEAMRGTPGYVDPAYSSTIQNIVQLPATVNLTIYQGDDFFMDMAVVDINGNPVNLTNTQPMSQIRAVPDGPIILASLVVTIDPNLLGLLHLQIKALDSNLLPASCAWDIQLSQPYVTTLAAGSVTVHPQVTI